MNREELTREVLKLSIGDQNAHIEAIQDARLQRKHESVQSLLSDKEKLDAKDDQINRYPFAQLIARRIVEDKNLQTYSIEGAWGSGKTNVMWWVKNELETHYNEEVVPVWFDPWKYESLGNIIVPLIEELKTERAPGKDFDEEVVKKVFAGVAFLGGTFIAAQALGWKTIAELISAIPFGKIKKLRDGSAKLSKLSNDFQELVDYVLSSYQPRRKKVVFLIDDLDRCLPENVVLLLESTKNFLRTEKACFIFAIDRHIISKGITVKYSGNLSKDDGDEYLEKIIDFPFELPFDALNYSTRMLRWYTSHAKMPPGNIEFAHELYKRANVRSVRVMKKVLNRYSLLSEIGLQKRSVNFHPQMLFFLIFLYEVFPQFYHFLQEFNQPDVLSSIRNTGAQGINNHVSAGDLFWQKFVSDPKAPVIQRIVRYFTDAAYQYSRGGQDQERAGIEMNKQLPLCLRISSQLEVEE